MKRSIEVAGVVLVAGISAGVWSAAGAAEPAGHAAALCRTFALHATTSWSGAAGSRIGTVAFTNRGSGACTLRGRPKVTIKDNRGRTLPVANLPEPGVPARSVLLHPKQRASSSMRWSNWCGGKVNLPVTLVVSLPGNGGRFSLRVAREARGLPFPLEPPPCLNRTHRQSVLYIRPIVRGVM